MSGFDAFNLARRYNENLAVKENKYKLEFSYQNTQSETVGYAVLKMKY
jgi:hypothetical protein